MTADLFFCSSIKDFGNDAAFAVVDEYGKQATADSYDGITDDVIQQILRFLQNEKEQKAQLESRPDRYDRTLDAFSEMPVQRIEETIHSSNVQLGNFAPPLENWQKSYQNGEYIRSASESGEEANYNMVDGLNNNRKKRKKGKKRRSVLKACMKNKWKCPEGKENFPNRNFHRLFRSKRLSENRKNKRPIPRQSV